MKKIEKIRFLTKFKIIKFIKKISKRRYVILYRKLLKKFGLNISIDHCYIDPTVWFDDYDFKLITIGKETTISRDVLLLTHDYSLNRAFKIIDNCNHGGLILKSITIGNNCFIGAKTIILPGTIIGDNCIIGAGTVVKGNIPNNSVVIGNPCKIIKTTEEYAKIHLEKEDYIIEKR